VLCALLVSGASGAAAAPAPAAPAASPPKLVVLLSVDQMRADYVDWFGAQWKHGLRTLLDKGAHFRDARYPYLGTVTCPGHTTLGTGAYPYRHGMILNSWWDRASSKLVECTDDPASPLVFYGASQAAPGDSARLMMVPTLADEMKGQLKSRTVSFSSKARSAIGLVGHHPDIVTWWEAGSWVTAKAFAPAPNAVVGKIVQDNPIDRLLDQGWDRALPVAAYKHADDAADERPPSSKWTRVFPHTLRYEPASSTSPRRFSLWEKSPFPDEYLVTLATGALAAMKLGQGEGTDFLAVSFSSLDLVGHAYGPRSHEVQDVLARLDRLLGKLLEALDTQVGRGRYVVALGADHGVAVYPEQLQAEKLDAGRVPMAELKTKLEAALKAELGPGDHVANVLYTDLYLAPGVLDRLHAKAGAAKRVLDAVRGVPGVAAAYSSMDLRDPASAKDPLQRAAALSHYPGRSGDLIFLPKVNWLTTPTGTTHGTQHQYDQHVPVLLYGAGIKPGKQDRRVSPADIAPTLAKLCGVTLPKAEGQPLDEALAPRAAAATRAAKKPR
jgi:predicted AlkP superfamily pyrophosphatase or phosphodiesterase